jgi:AmiR/NasT family two-component response regulator
MTTVLLLQDDPPAPLTLREDLATAGLHVLGVTHGCGNLVHDAGHHAPDVVVVAQTRPGDALLQALAALDEALPRPVLVFTGNDDPALMARALEAGVSAWVVNGYAGARLPALVQLAQARFARERALWAQWRDAEQRLAERKAVERAKGILVRARGVSDDDAFAILRTASMHTNLRLEAVSRQVIASSQLAEAVNRAGQLRMLSQRIVKLYLLRLATPRSPAQDALLAESMARVEANLAWLDKAAPRLPSMDRFARMAQSSAALEADLRERPTRERARAVDEGAELLLHDAEHLTEMLQGAGAVASLQVLNVAGRQRMLSQRFAKLALMGLLDVEAPTDANDAVLLEVQGDFEWAQAYLNGLPLTTADIRSALMDATRDWQLLLAAAAQAPRPAGRDRRARLDTVAHASEALLASFEQLTTQYEHSMQMLMG